jgi:hypothetical protein
MASATVTPLRSHLPTVDDTQRPWRIWHAQRKEQLVGRNFASVHNALERVLTLAYYRCKIGETLELFNISTGELVAQYTNTVEGVRIRSATTKSAIAKLYEAEAA